MKYIFLIAGLILMILSLILKSNTYDYGTILILGTVCYSVYFIMDYIDDKFKELYEKSIKNKSKL